MQLSKISPFSRYCVQWYYHCLHLSYAAISRRHNFPADFLVFWVLQFFQPFVYDYLFFRAVDSVYDVDISVRAGSPYGILNFILSIFHGFLVPCSLKHLNHTLGHKWERRENKEERFHTFNPKSEAMTYMDLGEKNQRNNDISMTPLTCSRLVRRASWSHQCLGYFSGI